MLLGADVARLRDLAKTLDKASEILEADTLHLRGALDQPVWLGEDSDQFRSEWGGGGDQQMRSAARALADAAEAARRNADQQEAASESDGSGVGGSPVAGPGGPFSDGTGGQSDLPPELTGGGEYPGHGWGPDDKPDLVPYEVSGALSDEKFLKLSDLLADAATPGAFDGNSNEIKELYKQLGELSDAELSDFLARTDAAQLARLADGMRDRGFSFQGNGIDEWGRVDFTSMLLKKADPSLRGKIFDAFDWAQPNGTILGFDDDNFVARVVPSRWATPERPVVGDDSSWRDVRQGSVGDCWSMSAMAAVAQADPTYIENHIRDNRDGTVSVKLYDDDGKAHWVTVTDDLPSRSDGSTLGAKAGPGGNWPAYVEKAMAVAYTDDNHGLSHGSYGALEFDRTGAAAPFLTGHKPDYVSFDKAVEAAKRGEPVLVLSPEEKPSNPPDRFETSHVFFVKGVDGDGNVILGNPWNAGDKNLDVVVSPEELERCFTNAAVLKEP